MIRGAVLLLLLACSPLFAQLRVSGETKVPRDRIVRLTAENAADAALIWDVDREDSVDIEEIGNRLLFTGPPGTYKIKCRAFRIKEGKTSVESARVTVVIGAGTPDPFPPDPNPPNPKPDPVPPEPEKPAKAWLVVIEETADAAKDRGRYFRDKGITDYLKSKGWKPRIFDKDVVDPTGKTPADLAPWLALVKSQKLPWFFIVDQTGLIRDKGELPSDPADLLARLKKIGG